MCKTLACICLLVLFSGCTTPTLTVVRFSDGSMLVRRVGYQPGKEEIGSPTTQPTSQPIYRADHGMWEGLALVAPFVAPILQGGR